ncbi:11960_t:CDS:2, partial [Dentiscutata heterogama]
MFAPRIEEGETIDIYLDLIYGPLVLDNELENDDNSDSSSTSNNDDIPIAGTQRHLRHAYQQFRQRMKKTHGRGRGRGRGRNCNQDKLWEMPNESSLTAMILDPRIKNFLFMNGPDRAQQRTQAEFLLRDLYTQLKQELTNKNLEVPYSTVDLINDAEDIFSKMWADNHVQTEDEVT